MEYDKEKYKIDFEKILSDLQIKITKGYIEVDSAKKHTEKDSKNKNSKQKRQ